MKLLLIEADPRVRLSLLVMLKGHYQVVCPEEGEDPVRFSRTQAPELALVGLRPLQSTRELHLCRALKTDLRPVPFVAALARGPLIPPAAEVLGSFMADGYYIGAPDAPRLVEFFSQVRTGIRPIVDVGAGLKDRIRRFWSRD